jgi:uncharacterized protein (DUF169 family)
MVDYTDVARVLSESLILSLPPIAISFAEQAPEGVPRYDGNAPAGCVFWEEAAKGPFVTSTSDHELCAIGVHTHNLAEPSASYATELGDVLKVMGDLDYVTEDEVAAIPVLGQQSRYVVYAPLAQTPLMPDVVLLFAQPHQSLVITEAAQRVDNGAPPAMGRPACAVIPQVINSGKAALSLGCCGARAYLDSLSDEVALWAFPGSKLAAYAEQIAAMAQANKTLKRFHTIRRQDVKAGERPTVEDSLERMATD